MELVNKMGEIASDLIMLGASDVPVYLLKLANKEWALIDGGISKDHHIFWQQLNLWVESPEDVKYWLITHKHFDHCGLLNYMCPLLPNITVLVSSETQKSWEHEKTRKVILSLNKSIGFEGDGLESVELHQLNLRSFNPDDELVLGEEHTLTVYAAPGHANDHVVFYDSKRQRLFAGDALGEFNYQTYQWQPLIFDDAKAYINTLKRLQSLAISQVLLGHGGMLCGHNVQTVIKSAYEQTKEFIERVKPRLSNANNIEQLAKALNKKWSAQSNRFVSTELHLNSMRFMLAAIKKIEIKECEISNV